MKQQEFEAAFCGLTGNLPFPWQCELYKRFAIGDFPSSCNVPTGLGKTSVIAIWLIAWLNHPELVPRRLVYVVNRRTVVDQTTDEVEKIRANLPKLNSNLDDLAISTIRGQFADNREWSADPSRPAVIAGTVDMIGSRILFSGYGIGRNRKPHHAGMLGQDVLLIHDEAHLEPAFQDLLVSIQDEQHELEQAGVPWKKLRVMELSATSRGEGEPFGLSAADKEDLTVRRRIEAKKTLHLHPLVDPKKLPEQIVSLAMRHNDSGKAILIFARNVDDVARIVAKLPAVAVRQLTGTMRGYEREKLIRDPIFIRFFAKSNRPKDIAPAEGTVFLVCTSAGEVGVNISANHLICDLSTFESMAQRFGRVNRFGDDDDTRIDVIHPTSFDDDPKKPLEPRLKNTLALLQALSGEASPSALEKLDKSSRLAAFAPTPEILPVNGILFDTWSLTTIKDKLPGRPSVEPYLHGIAEWEPPQTQVAWREEVAIVTGELRDLYDPGELLEDYPLKPIELLKDRSDRVWKELAGIAEREGGKFADAPVWLVSEDGRVNVVTLARIADKNNKEQIEGVLVLLPPFVGGMTPNGLLDGKSTFANDIADEFRVRVKAANSETTVNGRRRVRDSDVDWKLSVKGMRFIRKVDLPPPEDDEDMPVVSWRWFERAETSDTDGSRASSSPVLCNVHTADVVRELEKIISKQPELSEELKDAMKLAAKFHDQGKCRQVFQRVLGNSDPSIPWAKSGGWKTPRDLRTSYRHEFGSQLDFRSSEEFNELNFEMQEIVLHLIAAHHGRGRPCFAADEIFDPDHSYEDVQALAIEVPQRFARLQRKFGRWGLAYVESLLRAADHTASAHPSETVEEPNE